MYPGNEYRDRMVRLSTGIIGVVAAGFLLTACPGEDVETPDAGVEPDAVSQEDVEQDVEEIEFTEHRTTDCDSLMEEYCTMPWPSNLYLERDDTRVTGYTMDFGEASLPESNTGHIDPEPYRRLDGYGWGTPVMTLFPGVDISNMPGEYSVEDSIESEGDAFYFKVTEEGLEPVPFWAELDQWTEVAEEQILYLRPAVILEDDTRYVVGFRNLTDEDGNAFDRSETFEKYLDGSAIHDDELAWRQERFDEIFEMLEDAGVDRDELTLAWDFHTGSKEGLNSTLIQIIEDGVEAADAEGIEITIDPEQVIAYTPDEDEHVAYWIRGTIRVPHFLEHSARSGTPVSYLFHRDEDGKPTINDWREANFWMVIPHSAIDGEPHGLVTYGHGMLGRGNQVGSGTNPQIAAENNLIMFGADFIGFSESDVPQAILALGHPTYFEELIDRMHQGVLEYVLLGKAMRENLETHEDFADYDLTVDEDRIYYTGISQGGIYGVTVLAVDPTITRGHFGVPGQNYTMLLERSTNYGSYFQALRGGFSDRVDQSVVIPTIQLLWDQIDPISYLPRLNHDPIYEGMPKEGLFATAKADYQVAVVTKEITARSNIGIPLLENYDREREPWGVEWATYPHVGSGIVNYDYSNPWPEAGNLPPSDAFGDPHGLPRREPAHNEQLIHFLDTGEIIDVCDGEPCYFPRD